VGQSVYLILKVYEWEKRGHHAVRDDWLSFAGTVVSRAAATRNPDGEYPCVMSEKTGTGLEFDSFSGAGHSASCLIQFGAKWLIR